MPLRVAGLLVVCIEFCALSALSNTAMVVLTLWPRLFPPRAKVVCEGVIERERGNRVSSVVAALIF